MFFSGGGDRYSSLTMLPQGVDKKKREGFEFEEYNDHDEVHLKSVAHDVEELRNKVVFSQSCCFCLG